MKIISMNWRNFKGLVDGEIKCDGRDVVISGRNGVGKSSIASILPFVLFGRIPAKSFDSNGLVIETQMPTASIEFDSVTFKRSVTTRNQNRTFINGEEVSATQFNAAVLNLTNGAGSLVFNPFEFPTMHWKDQRDFLLKHFTTLPEYADRTSSIKAEIQTYKRTVAGIPYQISELQNQLSGAPDGDIGELEELILELQGELAELKVENYMQAETLLTRRLQESEKRRQELLASYRAVKMNCPTCGARLPVAKIDAARAKIVVEGKKIAAEITDLKAKIADVQQKSEMAFEKTLRAKQLQDEIRALSGKIAELQAAAKLRKRISELSAKEKSLNGRISELEHGLMNLQATRRSRLLQSESNVNAQFDFVKFKLFKTLANGELKEDCTATINGVPYASLSKGEKLKAALDILRTLQKKFQTEMPLLLDDAESYTSNSFVELSNQLFLFKVTDEDLKITVETARKAA